jgi:hypothetical protein
MLASDIVISTQTSKNNSVSKCTYGAFKEQLETALKAITVDGWNTDAYDNAHNVSYGKFKQDEGELLPDGEVIVYAHEGSNEGHRIELAIVDKNQHLIPILSIKFLCGRDEVWLTAKGIEMAICNGYFAS